jgi:hypothetical protein
MDASPRFADTFSRIVQTPYDPTEFWFSEPSVLSQLWRPIRAVHNENRRAAVANNVYMGRPMIVGINDRSQPCEIQHRWHLCSLYIKT